MSDDLRTEVQIVADLSDLETKIVAAKGTLQGLEAQLRSTGASLAQMGVAEAAAGRSMADLVGRTTAARSNLRDLQGQLGGVQGELRTVAGAAQSAGSAAETGGRGFRVTAGSMREVIVTAHELMTGNFSRIPGTMLVLTERAGGLGKVVGALKGWFGLAAGGAIALGGALAYVAVQAIRAENALRGVYNARSLTGGGGAAGAEAKAAAGAAAIHATGIASEQEANDYAAAVEKAIELSAENADKLMALGPALSSKMGGWQNATKFAEDTFKDTSAIEHYIEQQGLIAPGEEAAYEAAKKAGDAFKIQGIALDALTAQTSGFKGALEGAQRRWEELAPSRGEAAAGPLVLPQRIPEPAVPIGARPAEMQQRQQWELEYNQSGIERAAIERTIAEATKQRAAATSEAARTELDTIIAGAKAKLVQLKDHPGGEGEEGAARERIAAAGAAASQAPGTSAQKREAEAKAEIAAIQAEANNQKLTDEQRAQFRTELSERIKQLNNEEAAGAARAGAAGVKAAHEDYEAYAREEQNKLAAARGNQAETNAILAEWEAHAKASFAAGSAAYRSAMAEIAKAAQGASRITVEEMERAASAMDRAGQDKARGFEAGTQAQVKRGTLTPQQAIGFDIDAVAANAAAAKARQDAIMNSPDATPEQRSGAYWKEWDIGAQAQQQIAALEEKFAAAGEVAAEKFAAPFRQAFDRIGSGAESAITGMLTGEKGQKIAQQLDKSLIGGAVGMVGGALSKGAAGLIGGKSGQGLGDALADKIGSMISQTMLQISTTTAQTTATLAQTSATPANTAAQATSGPAGAAAGAIFGGMKTVFGFAHGGIVPSAAGGMVVPGATMALLHSREMVLPAHLADGIQGIINSGQAGAGAAGDAHFHAHFHGPADAPAIARWFRSNMKANAGAIREMFRSNALTPRTI